MKAIKIIFFMIAIAMAVTLILTTTNSGHQERVAKAQSSEPGFPNRSKLPVQATKRVSRFLQQKERNPKAADHCHKDHEVCNYITEGGGRNTTCCNNKCLDLAYDDKNCGACKKKCAFTETCCKGECVSLAYDKRHCGSCNHKCMVGGYCIYGMCDYA